jgi:hypothetical protein
MSLASRLPYDHPYAGGFPGLSSQALPTDADALDYLARVKAADGAGVETGVAVAVDAFFKDAKESGVLSSIRASCILAGARTLAGALVPLKNEGPELWTAPTPTIANAYGSSGTWDAGTQTATSSTSTISNTFPRFKFPVSVVAGKDYRITATLVVTDDDALTYYRLGGDGVVTPPAAVNGVITIDTTRTASTGAAVFELDFDSTIGPASVTIESLSIREVIAAPTNVADGFVEGDYSRTNGLRDPGGTSLLDTGRSSTDDPQDDVHLAAYLTALQAGDGGIVAARAGSPTVGTQLAMSAAGNFFTRCRTIGGDLPDLLATGFAGISRNSSSEYSKRNDGSTAAVYETSTAQSPGNYAVFSNATSGQPATDARIAFYSIGTAISDLALLDSRVTALVTSIGAAL